MVHEATPKNLSAKIQFRSVPLFCPNLPIFLSNLLAQERIGS